MAISASTVTTTDTLETFRVEFNNLVADVTSIQQVGASNIVISDGGNIGSASDQDAISIAANGVVTFSQAPSFSTGLTVADVDIDGATDIGAAIVDADLFIVDDGASGTNRKTAASRIKTYIADVTLTTAAQTNITSVGTLTALDVDNININGNTITASTGAVNITPASGSAIVLDGAVNIDAGVVTGITSLTSNAILIADAGTIGSASSTSAITIASTGIVTFVDDILIKDGGTIGSASSTSAITIASSGIVTLVDDLLLKDAATIGNASVADVMTLAATGIVTFKDDIIIKDGGTIGAASATDAITIASTGIVTFVDDIIIKDAGTIGSASDTDAISISSGGVVNISATTANTGTGDGALTVAGGVGIALDASIGDDLRLISDDAILSFGANSEITVTHVHDVGLTITNTIADTDNRPTILQLKSEEDAIVADDVIASIEMAAGDSDGTDAAVVAAGIHAIAEGTFSASANATKLVFTTGVSEAAAASATAKMTLSSAGLLTIADDFVIKDGGTIGVASANDAMTISSAGIVTFKDDILIKDGGTIGVASAATAITIASTGVVTFVDDIIIKDAGTIGSASDTDAISISSGGVVGISATTANTNASDGALTVAGGVGIALDASIGDDLRLISDSAILSFGANSEITVTHVHDVGLTITNTIADTDNRPTILQLKSEEDAIVADDVIASIEMAAGDSDGTDGAVVAAGIHAIAEGTFAADANATKLVFTTGVSETAAASATAKMTLSSAGLLTIADDLMIKDGGTIGVATTNDAITIASTGIVTFKDDIIIKDGGTIGSVTDADSITIASDGKVTFGQQTTHSSGILVADGGTIGSASDTDAISISSGGVVAISATTANTDASDGALTVAGGASVAADFSVGDDLRLISDDAILSFGVNSDVTLTHVHNTGIRLSDSMALLLGTGDDISFSWDGTDGHLAVAGTLNVEGSGETLAKFIDDGAVELYHNNVKKFETTAAGVTLTGELLTTGFSSSDFAAAFIVIEDGGTDGSGTDAGDNIIIEDGGTDGAGANAGDDLLMENVTSWVTSGFTIRDSFGNHLQTVNGVS